SVCEGIAIERSIWAERSNLWRWDDDGGGSAKRELERRRGLCLRAKPGGLVRAAEDRSTRSGQRRSVWGQLGFVLRREHACYWRIRGCEQRYHDQSVSCG